jgi:hypothetical protein
MQPAVYCTCATGFKELFLDGVLRPPCHQGDRRIWQDSIHMLVRCRGQEQEISRCRVSPRVDRHKGAEKLLVGTCYFPIRVGQIGHPCMMRPEPISSPPLALPVSKRNTWTLKSGVPAPKRPVHTYLTGALSYAGYHSLHAENCGVRNSPRKPTRGGCRS